MRTIIAGSRGITDPTLVRDAIAQSEFAVTHVLSGAARGVDRLAEAWAHAHTIPVTRFPADWTREGTRAGFLRNARMAVAAEALIAIWDGQSPGTRHMIQTAKDCGLRVFVFRVGAPSA